MKILKLNLILTLLLELSIAKVSVIQPIELQQKFNFESSPGSINYSVSTFGEISFTSNEVV